MNGGHLKICMWIRGLKGVIFYFRPVVRSVKMMPTEYVALILIQEH